MTGVTPDGKNIWGLAPDLACNPNDQLQFLDFVLDRDAVALDGAGEAALWAQGQLVERHVTGRLVDPSLQLVRRFERPLLAGDQAEDDRLAFGHETERGEAAGARRVVFQEIAV